MKDPHIIARARASDMGKADYDSSGKNKPNDARSRSTVLIISLLVGVCIGVVLSERLYVHSQVGTTLAGASAWYLPNTLNHLGLSCEGADSGGHRMLGLHLGRQRPTQGPGVGEPGEGSRESTAPFPLLVAELHAVPHSLALVPLWKSHGIMPMTRALDLSLHRAVG